VGLDEIDCLDGDIIGSAFLEYYQMKDSLGSRWLQMKPETLIKKLASYL
jgi:hypothetical protein